jgi:hypothetical protein
MTPPGGAAQAELRRDYGHCPIDADPAYRAAVQQTGTSGQEASMAGPVFNGGAFLSGLMRLQLGNLNALAEAQRSAMEGLAALGRQPPRLPKLAMPTSSDPRNAIEAPIEALKAAVLDGTAQANAMLEITARANAEAAGILQERALAALDEWKALLLAASRAGG